MNAGQNESIFVSRGKKRNTVVSVRVGHVCAWWTDEEIKRRRNEREILPGSHQTGCSVGRRTVDVVVGIDERESAEFDLIDGAHHFVIDGRQDRVLLGELAVKVERVPSTLLHFEWQKGSVG